MKSKCCIKSISKIIIFIIIMIFSMSACTSEPDSNDGKCDICGKDVYRYQLGDGAEYCKEHFEDAAEWYLNQN